MKKQFLLSLIFTLFSGIIYGQHLIRVNNNAGTDADYTTLQDANDNASNGDTIYVEGSTITYTGANISKILTIIGPGYFLSENDSTQANGLAARFLGNISFTSGSNGSIITGCECSNDIQISVDDIKIIRCWLHNIVFSGTSNNTLIIQNYINGFINVSGFNPTVLNSIISNNIIKFNITLNSLSGPIQITNNILSGASSYFFVYNSNISNNILCSSSGQINENTGNTITNNILASDGINANGNQYNMVMDNVFIDYSGSLGSSTDGMWQLKSGSPAIGAGASGVDCGVFGGVAPYVLSGMPALPHIYEATIPATASSDQGLSCTIKVKSGK